MAASTATAQTNVPSPGPARSSSAVKASLYGLPVASEEIVPSKEPVAKGLAKSTVRLTIKLPVAPANRPVPPVMVAVSTMEKTPGVSVGVPSPAKSAVTLSPFAVILKGSVVNGRIDVRSHDNLSGHQFVASNGAWRVRVAVDSLRRAAESADVWRGMLANPGDHARIKRGLNVLLEGLQEHFGQERLHAFVRALEALILPRIGETRRQFAVRCQTFAVASAASQACLEECFDMRSVVEHMNDPTTCLSSYPVAQHEAIALRRVRQIEAFARFAYERLLSRADLRQHFTSDATIADFWRLPSDQRQALCGTQFDINAVA